MRRRGPWLSARPFHRRVASEYWPALLCAVEHEHVLEGQVGVRHEHACVGLVRDGSVNGEPDLAWVRKVIVEKRQAAASLRVVHALDSVAKVINHVELGHGLHKRGVAVAPDLVAFHGVHVGLSPRGGSPR